METNKKTKTKTKGFFYQREYSSYVEIDLSDPLHNELAYLFFDRDLSNPKWCPGVFPWSIKEATELMKKIEGFVGKPDASNLYLKVYDLDENGKVIGTYKKPDPSKMKLNETQFSTSIFSNEDDEYVCDPCAIEKPGPFRKVSYEVKYELDVIWCRFCQKEIPDPAEN